MEEDPQDFDLETTRQDICSGEASRIQSALELLSDPEVFAVLSANNRMHPATEHAPATSDRASLMTSVLLFCPLDTIPEAFFQTWLCGENGLMMSDPNAALNVFLWIFDGPDKGGRQLAEKYLLSHQFNGGAAWDLKKKYFLEVLDRENKPLADELRKPRNGQPSPYLP